MNTGTQTAGSRTMTRHCTSQEEGVVPGGHRPCDLVTVPARQGLEALDILRLRESVGPVLHDGLGETLGFLVPAGTAAGWDLPGSACVQTHGPVGQYGGSLEVTGSPEALASAIAEPPIAGTGWLLPPVGPHARVTEPARLRAALSEAARTLAAVDRCR